MLTQMQTASLFYTDIKVFISGNQSPIEHEQQQHTCVSSLQFHIVISKQ